MTPETPLGFFSALVLGRYARVASATITGKAIWLHTNEPSPYEN